MGCGNWESLVICLNTKVVYPDKILRFKVMLSFVTIFSQEGHRDLAFFNLLCKEKITAFFKGQLLKLFTQIWKPGKKRFLKLTTYRWMFIVA